MYRPEKRCRSDSVFSPDELLAHAENEVAKAVIVDKRKAYTYKKRQRGTRKTGLMKEKMLAEGRMERDSEKLCCRENCWKCVGRQPKNCIVPFSIQQRLNVLNHHRKMNTLVAKEMRRTFYDMNCAEQTEYLVRELKWMSAGGKVNYQWVQVNISNVYEACNIISFG